MILAEGAQIAPGKGLDISHHGIQIALSRRLDIVIDEAFAAHGGDVLFFLCQGHDRHPTHALHAGEIALDIQRGDESTELGAIDLPRSGKQSAHAGSTCS